MLSIKRQRYSKNQKSNVCIKPDLCCKGYDGWIRVWDLESIFNAKAIDTEADKALFHLDPMNEVKVEVGAILKTIVKSKCVAEDQNDWFIQVLFSQNEKRVCKMNRMKASFT